MILIHSGKTIVQEYYSKRALDYDLQKKRTWKNKLGFEDRILDEILRNLDSMKSKRILEVGIGSGRIALSLLKGMQPEFVGLDLSREMLEIAHRKMSDHRHLSDLLQADAENIPFRSDNFDAVICISTFHYFPSAEQALKELCRVLKRGGTLVYGDVIMHEQDTDGFLDILEKTISHAHARYHRPSEIRRLLESFKINVRRIQGSSYRKSYQALLEDKARYFNIEPNRLYELIWKASKEEKSLYGLAENEMTLSYTLIIGERAS